MTRFSRLLLYAIVCSIIWIDAMADDLSTFCRYTSKDGLSCNYVHCIIQDTCGFLWIGTEYGLNRFDGVHFRSYYMEETPSLYGNQILHLSLMSNGKMLIAGNNGLVVSYDEKSDSFVDMMPDDFKTSYFKGITNFYEDENSRTWASTTNGIYSYWSEYGKFGKYPGVTDSTEFSFVSVMIKDDFGRFYCGTYSGVSIFDKDGRHLKEYDEKLSIGMMVSNINRLESNKFLVSSFVGGLWIIDIGENGEISSPRALEIPFRNINSIIKDSKGRYWFGTAGSGLWRATYDGKFHFEKIEPKNSKNEELQKIHCLYEDRNGDIWIGTQNAGLLRYSTMRNTGSIHSADIGFPSVDGTSFVQDDEGNIYVASDGHGIFVISPDYQILQNITIEDGLSSNNVLSLKTDINGDILIVVWGGELCRLNTKTRKVTKIPFDGIETSFSTCKSLAVMPDGVLWVAVAGDGVYVKEKENWSRKRLQDTTQFKIPDIWIEDIIYSPTGVKWIISSRTIWRCDEKGDRPMFPDVDATQVHQPLLMIQGVCDDEGNLYVVSTQGVIRFDEDGNQYKWLDYLPDGQYSSILRDKKGIFWTSGSNGIISFEDEKQTYAKILLDERYRSRNYFTHRAAFIDKDGRFYFGSTEGFVMFDPRHIHKEKEVDYLAFSRLYVKGKKQEFGSEYLPECLSDLKRLKLNYDETNISITLDVIDFSGLNDVELSYRLRGLDRDWIDMQEKREIKISHIPHGSYVLEVRAKKGLEEVYSKKISLPIVVSPPWWKTWWFDVIATLIIALSISLVIFHRFKKIKAQRELLRQMVLERTKKLDDINHLLEQKQQVIEQRNKDLEQALAEKDRLLSVIAHDLKNPMFAIVGALDSVLKHHESLENTWKVLKDIYLSAFNLQSAMVKLLEWARGKQTEVTCHIESSSVREMVKEVLSLLNAMFVEKQIDISITYDLQHCAMMDSRMVATALRNVLTNAVKFTPEKGSISIDVTEHGRLIDICIQDTGVGMSEEQLNSIRNDENVISTLGTKMEKGTGLGFKMAKDFVEKSGGSLMVESKIEEGTKIIISLPVSDKVDEDKLALMQEDKNNTFEINADLLQGNTVMIVDDDPLILLHIRTILEPYFRVVEANNGEEGYDVALKEQPDIILSDVEMPLCDGITMYERLKQNSTMTQIPLVFLSARNAESDRLMGLYKGAIDYITKPFYEKELLMKLTNILMLRRNQQQQVLENNYTGNMDEKMESTINPLLKSLLDLIAEKYSDSGFSAEDMSASLAMSKSTFSRKLKSITDKTPTEILNEYRLHKAQALLKEGGKTITEIAYAVGFNDPLYFSKKYKSFFGISPSLEK